MNMKIIHTAIIAAACCVLPNVGMAAEVELEASDGDIVPGEWNSHFNKGLDYAQKYNVPMVLFWANPGCSNCKHLADSVKKADFVAWMKSSGYVFVFTLGKKTAEDKAAKEFAKNSSGDFPYISVYYNNGGWKKYNFSGLSGRMPASGGSLQEKLMNSIKYVITGNSGSSTGGSSGGSGASIPESWNRARNVTLAVKEGDYCTGIVSVKLGKANKKKGTVSVSATTEFFGGKKIKMSGKVVAGESFSLSKSGYTLELVGVSGSSISGSLNGKGVNTDLEQKTFGGSMAQKLVFTFENVSDIGPGSVYFTCSGTKWSFPKDSEANQNGVKLSYKSSKGYFSGKFSVKSANKKKTAKVSGYVLDGVGYGIATIKGMPNINVSIKPVQ